MQGEPSAPGNQVQALSLHGSQDDAVDEERDKFIPAALKQIADLRAAQVIRRLNGPTRPLQVSCKRALRSPPCLRLSC